MKKELRKAARAGRFGDDRLLHVSQAEIDGLASLIPGGKLPVNPETGLHEAFFFLPFLAPALAAAAPAATAAAGALAAGTAAAAAPALAAAAPLAAGTAAAGAGAAGAAGAGLGALGAAAAPTAATAAMPALTSAGTALAPTAATAGAAGLPSVLAGTPMAGTAASAAPALTGAAVQAPTAAAATKPLEAAIGSNVIPGAGTAATAADAMGAAGVSGMAPAATAKGGLAGLLGGLDGSKLLQYGALGAMLMPRGGGGGGKEDKDSKKNVGAKQYDSGDVASAPNDGNDGGITREFNYYPHARYYADGGIASLAPDNMSGGGDDNQLIDATVAALQGQTPNPDAVIQQFIQTFGPDALKDLIAQVQGQQSNSDGMSDSVPAQINAGIGGTAPAQLSEGEYVVPADVVSHLGNGSTEAGARQLKDMEARVRKDRGASEPKSINPLASLPA